MAACDQCGVEGKKLYYSQSPAGMKTFLCKSCHPELVTSDELNDIPS
jgi:hypothetical protein